MPKFSCEVLPSPLPVVVASCSSSFEYIMSVHAMHAGAERNVFVCIVALRPKSTAMVIAGRSVHLTTLFPGQA